MAIVRGREGRVGTAGGGWRLCGIRVIGGGVGSVYVEGEVRRVVSS